jgi:hypothetical protein
VKEQHGDGESRGTGRVSGGGSEQRGGGNDSKEEGYINMVIGRAGGQGY